MDPRRVAVGGRRGGAGTWRVPRRDRPADAAGRQIHETPGSRHVAPGGFAALAKSDPLFWRRPRAATGSFSFPFPRLVVRAPLVLRTDARCVGASSLDRASSRSGVPGFLGTTAASSDLAADSTRPNSHRVPASPLRPADRPSRIDFATTLAAASACFGVVGPLRNGRAT